MKQKVCFVGSFTAGGTERVTYLLVNELLLHYDSYDIFVLNLKDNKPCFPLSERCRYSCIAPSSKLGVIKSVRHFLKKNSIEVLVNIEAMVGIFSIPATLGLRCKNVVWEHANYFQTQGSRWTRLVRKIWMAYADSYVVLTKRDLANFKQMESPKCRLSYIYNPVSLLRSSKKEYQSSSHVIMSAGHLLPIKNFEIIPDIVRLYIESYPDWTWVIYGGGSMEARQKMLDKISKLGLDGKIILCGRLNDIDIAYDNAAIYALTSLQEGLPTVLLEAMLHGIPCVSFDIETGPDEIIIDGENGYLVPAFSVEKYAEALMKLMESEERRKLFSHNTSNSLCNFILNESVEAWHNVLKFS